MRIIVTRPYQSGRRTAERVQQLGHFPAILPLTAPSHDTLAAERGLEQAYGALVITSAEAVRALVKLGDKLQPHLGARLFTVGRVTAATARKAGFTATVPADGTGLDLAEMIIATIGDEGMPTAPLLYLAGQPRTPTFERLLKENEIGMRTVDCYHMLPLDHDPDHLWHMLVEQPVDAVLFYSRENVERFFSLPVFIGNLDPLATTRFFCLSQNIASGIPDGFQNRIFIAPTPDEEALLNLL